MMDRRQLLATGAALAVAAPVRAKKKAMKSSVLDGHDAMGLADLRPRLRVPRR
jgi:hypothetical protein